MKKIIFFVALFMLCVSSVNAQKVMRSFGPISLSNTKLLDYAIEKKDAIGVYEGTTNMTFTLVRPTVDPLRNRERVAWMPKGYNADGTTWDYANDVAGGGNINIIGLSGKHVFLLITFANGDQRIYSVALKAVTSTRSAAASKINGSTAVLANYNASTTDHRSCWVDDGVGNIIEYNRQMTQKKTYTAIGNSGVQLPISKSTYTYDINVTATHTEITLRR